MPYARKYFFCFIPLTEAFLSPANNYTANPITVETGNFHDGISTKGRNARRDMAILKKVHFKLCFNAPFYIICETIIFQLLSLATLSE